LDKLNRRIKQINSAAVRGVLYAQAGLLDQAEQELQMHLKLHPADEIAKKLLRTIKSWRES
jgi:ribosomal protein S15P/S13E